MIKKTTPEGRSRKDAAPKTKIKPLKIKKKPVSKSLITRALIKEFCSRLIDTGSARKVCRDGDDMPSVKTIFAWLAKASDPKADAIYSEFMAMYVDARKLAADYKFDGFVEELEDTVMQPVMLANGEQMRDVLGVVIRAPTQVSVSMAKLKLDTYKWFAAKENPKKYGDKIQQEHTGKDGGELAPPMLIVEQYVKPTK